MTLHLPAKEIQTEDRLWVSRFPIMGFSRAQSYRITSIEPVLGLLLFHLEGHTPISCHPDEVREITRPSPASNKYLFFPGYILDEKRVYFPESPPLP